MVWGAEEDGFKGCCEVRACLVRVAPGTAVDESAFRVSWSNGWIVVAVVVGTSASSRMGCVGGGLRRWFGGHGSRSGGFLWWACWLH